MKLTNSDSNKIGIAAEGLRSSAFRKLAQEELKFSNTVVASGLDLLMIGTTSGRQKRERKVPSRYKFKNYSAIKIFREISFVYLRYQDTDAFFDSSTGMPATNAQKAAAVMMLEENTHIVPGNS